MGASIDANAGTPEYLRALNQTTDIFSGFVSTPISIACWVKNADFTGTQTAIGLNRGNTNNHYFSLRTKRGTTVNDAIGSALAKGGSPSGDATVAEVTSVANTWILLVGVFDTGDAARRVFCNSATPSSDETTSVTPTSIDSITFGVQQEFSGSLGTMDIAEAAIWNTSLSNANVTDLLTKTADQVAAANLQNYWPLVDDLLDDKGSVTLVDVNANVTLSAGNHPSLSGGGATISDVNFTGANRGIMRGVGRGIG